MALFGALKRSSPHESGGSLPDAALKRFIPRMNAWAASQRRECGLGSQTHSYTGPVVNPGPYAELALKRCVKNGVASEC